MDDVAIQRGQFLSRRGEMCSSRFGSDRLLSTRLPRDWAANPGPGEPTTTSVGQEGLCFVLFLSCFKRQRFALISLVISKGI